MTQTILEKNIIEILGIDSLSDQEKAVFLEQIADTVMEPTLLRFVAGLTEEQEESFEYYLSTNPKPDAMLVHLTEHYKSFSKILEEEIVDLKGKAIRLMGDENGEKKVK